MRAQTNNQNNVATRQYQGFRRSKVKLLFKLVTLASIVVLGWSLPALILYSLQMSLWIPRPITGAALIHFGWYILRTRIVDLHLEVWQCLLTASVSPFISLLNLVRGRLISWSIRRGSTTGSRHL